MSLPGASGLGNRTTHKSNILPQKSHKIKTNRYKKKVQNLSRKCTQVADDRGEHLKVVALDTLTTPYIKGVLPSCTSSEPVRNPKFPPKTASRPESISWEVQDQSLSTSRSLSHSPSRSSFKDSHPEYR